MCFLSGRLDPRRTSRMELRRDTVAARIRSIIDNDVEDDWEYGMAPYTRSVHLPHVSVFPWYLLVLFLVSCFFRLTDLASHSCSSSSATRLRTRTLCRRWWPERVTRPRPAEAGASQGQGPGPDPTCPATDVGTTLSHRISPFDKLDKGLVR